MTSGETRGSIAGVATLTKHPLQPSAREVEAALGEFGSGVPRHAVLQRLSKAMQGVAKALGATEPDWLVPRGSTPRTLGELHTRCGRVKTTLGRLSVAEAMALVIHGYVQAMGAMATIVALEGEQSADLPMKFPGLDRFERLLTREECRPTRNS
jgi:hypothetical protein